MELSEMTAEAIDYIFENITVERLNGWERGFIESVSDRWDKIRHLTDLQKTTLGKIWDEAVSEKAPITEFERELARTVGRAVFPPATASKHFIRAINEEQVKQLSESARIFLAFIAHRFRRQYTLTAEQWKWVNEHREPKRD